MKNWILLSMVVCSSIGWVACGAADEDIEISEISQAVKAKNPVCIGNSIPKGKWRQVSCTANAGVNCNVRATASNHGEIIGKMSSGQGGGAIACKNGWAELVMDEDGWGGWVSGEYLQIQGPLQNLP